MAFFFVSFFLQFTIVYIYRLCFSFVFFQQRANIVFCVYLEIKGFHWGRKVIVGKKKVI